MIARDWFRYAEHDSQLLPTNKHIKKDFLIYNRAWAGTREYRLCFAEQIVDSDLSQHCQMSFSAYDMNEHYSQHQFVNAKFQISNFNLEDLFAANTHSATASADYVSEDYNSTAVEIVLETMFDDTRWHLTEKTLRPIACGQPFILCATPGSLQYLREYGFETFDGLIDETYDTVADSRERLACVIKEMQRIQHLPDSMRQQLYQDLAQISHRNQQRFFSAEFQQCIIAEFVQNIQQGLQEMAQHRTGRVVVEYKKLYENVQEDDDFHLTSGYQYLMSQITHHP